MNGPLVQSQLDDIFWSVFLDRRKYFQLTDGKPTSGLDSLVGMLSRDQIPSFVGVPYHRLLPTGNDSKHQKLSNGAYTPVRGGGGGGGRSKEKDPMYAFREMTNHHKLIKIQWEKTKADIDGKVLMKNVISRGEATK